MECGTASAKTVIQKILDLQIYSSLKDQMVWDGSFSGDFSVASAWAAIRQIRNYLFVEKLVWSSIVPLKVSFFHLAPVAEMVAFR